jgi:hypothetical protein
LTEIEALNLSDVPELYPVHKIGNTEMLSRDDPGMSHNFLWDDSQMAAHPTLLGSLRMDSSELLQAAATISRLLSTGLKFTARSSRRLSSHREFLFLLEQDKTINSFFVEKWRPGIALNRAIE